jgi:acetyl-CoA carboxylase, biotin carboxylase subunit
MDKILAIAKETGAEAIHPGYGLLSENAEFAGRCIPYGIKFIGPSPSAMEAMGEKIQARQLMSEAGVPLVPGVNKALNNIEEAIEIAKELGYPVLVKASAGGGGIGMQLVEDELQLAKAFITCQGRAKAYFGNGAIYLEKAINNPRHIEIQVAADELGNYTFLFERECSIQRRHQKVIEEAPSSFVNEELRQKMGETAVRAAKAINYSNLGTVEFLVDEEENFYFLEMNTRLQVEHPVTELITGLDLVEEQLKIAYGLPLSEGVLKAQIRGHAIEVRVYAEDPTTFLPAPGTITKVILPEAQARIDHCIKDGWVVSPYYDPMIAKIITWGEDRNEAIDKLTEALKNTKIQGIKTNLPLLQGILTNQQFRGGLIDTKFIELMKA